LLVIVAIAAQLFAEQAKRADDFVESMGIGSHLNRVNWPNYPENEQWDSFGKPRLLELGIRHLRSGCQRGLGNSLTTEVINRYNALCSAGIKLTWHIGEIGDETMSFADQKSYMQAIGLNNIAAIEGVNEPQWGWANVTYNGKTGADAAVDFQRDLWNSMKNDNAFKNIPIQGPSFYACDGTEDTYLHNVGQWANYGNYHPYLEGDNSIAPGWQAILDGKDFGPHTLSDIRDYYPAPMPLVFTETGCASKVWNDYPWLSGTELSQGKKIPMCYLEAFRIGIARIYIYCLIEDQLGLCDNSWNRKQAFYGVKNLITLLGEKGQNSFATHNYPVTFTGATASVHHLVLEKSTGVWYVILWNDVDNYNNSTDKDIATADIAVTVNFGQTISTVKTYTPATGSNGINVLNTYSNVSQQTFGVPDHPLIIECSAGTPPARSAYNGPHKIPGRVEAEDYDNSGEGTAYHDSDSVNNGGGYRTDGVDVKTTADAQGGGYDVGWTQTGEWMEYTIDSIKADKYDIRLRVGSAVDGAQVRVKLDGATLGTVNVPNLGNWTDKQTITIAGVTLAAGTKKILRLEIIGGGADINWIEFAKATATGARLAPRTSTPLSAQMVEILSLDGRVVARQSLNDRNRMDVGSMALGAGIYFIRRHGQTVSDRQMIIVNK
jgi:hypothetical protein